jgi:hypothetical protein
MRVESPRLARGGAIKKGPAGRDQLQQKIIFDDNAVLQKLILSTAAVPPSYLGPAPLTR